MSTQPALFDLANCPAGEASPLTTAWRRECGGQTCWVVWSLGNTGYTVRHCGHPTALFPWMALTPAGESIPAPNGRCFTSCDLARAAVLEHYLKTGGLPTGREAP